MPAFYVAQKESERCLAYSRNSHRRCRLRRLYGQKTCTTHKNYYRRWFITHQPWYRIAWLSERESAEWRFQLSNGHVDVPEVHVRGLQASFVEYYRFLIAYAHIPVGWSQSCLQQCVASVITRLFQGTVGAEIELNLLLNTPEDAFAIFQQLLYSWVQYLVLHRQTSGQWIEYDTAVNVLQRCMSSSNWKQLLFSFQLKTCIENRASILHVPGSLLAAVDTQYIQPLQTILYPQFTLQWKNAVKRRLEPFHEELMQVTWHPSRVEAMLEAGIEPWDN